VIVIVDEPEPGALIDVGLKLALAPVGSPDAARDTAELKLPEIVVEIVVVPLVPWVTEIDAGDDEIEKSEL
jgi:hypothetical protein